MNVLLLAPAFYGYYSVIKQEIEKEGNRCEAFAYPSSFIYKLLVTLLGESVGAPFINKFINKVCRRTEYNPDVVLIVKGSVLKEEHYERLKKRFQTSRFVLYIWDDIELDKKELDITKFFDAVFSYNQEDCEKYGFVFRPMFFDQSKSVIQQKNIDLFYIASYRKNRFDFINRIVGSLKDKDVVFKIVLRCSPVLILSHLRNLKFLSYFRLTQMKYDEMINYLGKAKCCVELCRPHQKSLSTRSFEALGTRTKVITTNQSIKNYDFYNPQNILVVDENNPIIPTDWINEPYTNIKDEILNRYTLQYFVRTLLLIQ